MSGRDCHTRCTAGLVLSGRSAWSPLSNHGRYESDHRWWLKTWQTFLLQFSGESTDFLCSLLFYLFSLYPFIYSSIDSFIQLIYLFFSKKKKKKDHAELSCYFLIFFVFLNYLSICSIIDSFFHPFTHHLIYLFVYLSIHLFIYLFICFFILLFMYLLVQSLLVDT